MLRNDIEHSPERQDRIGNSSFENVCKTLISVGTQAKNEVNYAPECELYETFDLTRLLD